MKNITKFFATTLLYIFLLPGCLAADGEQNLQSKKIETENYIRNWDTKGFGKRLSDNFIYLLANESLSGDVVVIRQLNPLIAEVYKETGSPSEWIYKEASKEKILTAQPAGIFLITEVINGKEGGLKIEKFKLH